MDDDSFPYSRPGFGGKITFFFIVRLLLLVVGIPKRNSIAHKWKKDKLSNRKKSYAEKLLRTFMHLQAEEKWKKIRMLCVFAHAREK